MKYFIIAFLIILILLIIAAFIIKFIHIWKSRKYVPEYNSCRQVKEFNKELYPSGFAYDPEKDIFYSLKDAWQRNYGYKDAYDEMATYFNMIIDREPITFKYDNRYWMIEIWKGQYGLATGAEVGIYVSDNGKSYKCVSDDEEIYMGLMLIKNGRILAHRHESHWWITAFNLGEYSRPKDLAMIVDLELYDSQMCNAVVRALKKLGYSENDFAYYRNVIRIRFMTPHTKIQKSRRTLTARIKMLENRNNCRIYRKYTRRYKCTLDKIGYIKIRIPFIYNSCIKMLKIWKKLNG